MISAWPPSMTATAEYVVPRSMPMTLLKVQGLLAVAA